MKCFKRTIRTKKLFSGQRSQNLRSNISFTVYNREISSIIAEDIKITEGKISLENNFILIEKSVEEIIHLDKQITDAIFPEFQMLFIERSTEDMIAADNQIVESEISVKDQSLDFKIINRK